ncbi:MAG: hypothetical protein Hyperionvirus15_11 [Hyperionvirus sp.]|uniref:DUF7831 domain-containing protein n=1 Tax=Hyperionvirus sp. TaxID=2487770 RepID=A0A3G5ADK8_9VIRU|nr:MAG: hypothetical protein Hyperionvirus15_11 [Hyperionvirus sp.]
MKVFRFKRNWTLSDVRRYSKFLFVFGDNDIRRGKGGQAIIRDEPNAMGVPSKKRPSGEMGAFYFDEEFDENVRKIKGAIGDIVERLRSGEFEGIIVSKDGIGTGLAKLPDYAPRTYKFLVSEMNALFREVMKM